ncbi:hypothetical protein F3J24_15420 [Comamonas sp. Tr-654]|nr:hypothetical protein [Comamonas sp. Tr-654]
MNTKSNLLFVLLIKPGSFGETIIRRLARSQQAHFFASELLSPFHRGKRQISDAKKGAPSAPVNSP